MTEKIVAWICSTIIVLAIAGCDLTKRSQNQSIACVRAGGDWQWPSCRRTAP